MHGNVLDIARRMAAAAALATLAGAGPAGAQVITDLNPSARSAAMGGAGAAVGWGAPTNAWANPAMAATVPGLTVRLLDVKLLPGFTDVDARFQSSSLTISAAGMGLALEGRPLGGSVLEARSFPFPFSERTDGLAVALSGARLADALLALAGREARVSGWADLGWGRRWKSFRSLADPSVYSSRDEGWLARVTPIDMRRGKTGPGHGVRLDLAAGYSRRDAPLADWTDHRSAFAARLMRWGPDREGEPVAPLADAFGGGFGTPFDLTLAWDHDRYESSFGGVTFSSLYAPYEVDQYGAELVLVGVLAARFGYVHDPDHDITKPAWGLGARVPLGRAGDARYDLSSSPQAYPRRLWRHEVTLRLDPIARWFGPRSPSAR